MIYILNAIVPPKGGQGILKITPASLQEVQEAVAMGAKSYIGHPATAAIIGLPPNRGEAKPEAGDVAFVLRLKFRPTQSGVEVEVRPEDLEILRVEYL